MYKNHDKIGYSASKRTKKIDRKSISRFY